MLLLVRGIIVTNRLSSADASISTPRPFRICDLHAHIPSRHDARLLRRHALPSNFSTELEAQREIADNQLTRIQEFLDGQRDYEDAITTDEFILPVDVWPDGHISNEGGSVFGKLR